MASRKDYVPCNLSYYKIIQDRMLNGRKSILHSDDIIKKMYTSMDINEGSRFLQVSSLNEGGIFNLEFNLDGRLLVAACEEKSVLIYDAFNQKQIKHIPYAHSSCVNCIRFLEPNVFATCSDDSTVKVWDTRWLKSPNRTLQGHSNWVKNIEYIEKDRIMITSAFDGSIYAWDLNSPTENNLLYNSLFKMSGLMRTKLTPDGSKMIICTTGGYIIIIHNLNIETLTNDIKSFRPNLYRLMQLSGQTFPTVTIFNHLFKQDREFNRLEFIDDFPNEAEVISSLQIHPMGWCALSRNINADEDQEWSSVHDIQTKDPNEYKDAYEEIEEPDFVDDLGEGSTPGLSRRPTDIWMGFIYNEHLSAFRTQRSSAITESVHTSMGILNSGIIGHNTFATRYAENNEDRNHIILNLPRLTHFIKEKSSGKGYIKELCFSSDGRIICSPYGKGVRLLGFNNQLQEMCYCVPSRPAELFTIAEMNNYHPDYVVSCKFSPRHYQLVSGCLGGKIVWYKPVL